MDRTRKLAEESVPRLLWTFSLPAIVGMLAQALYNIVDGIFIGRAIGEKGLAGITVALPYMLVLVAFSMLIGFGGNAVISIRLGEGKRDEAERVLGSAVMMMLVVSVVLTVVGLTNLDRLLRLFGAGPEALPYARDYLSIIVLGTIFQIFGFGLNAPIRGEGNPRIAMLTLLIGVVLNTILAPIFIFGFGWGMKGAAIATVLSQAVSAFWVLGYFLSGNSLLKLRRRTLRFDLPICGKILMIGSPPFAMQMAAAAMSSLLFNQLALYGGVVAVSVFGVIYRAVMVFNMPIFGISQGAQPIIGFNYGARKFDRVTKTLQTAILAASAIGVFGFVVVMVFPAQVIWLFAPQEASMIEVGTHAMHICLLMLPLIGFQVVSATYFQAVGKPRQAMVLMLSRQVLLLIPAVLILPRFFGLDGVWSALPASDFGSAVLTGCCLFLELRHLRDRHLEMQPAPVGVFDTAADCLADSPVIDPLP